MTSNSTAVTTQQRARRIATSDRVLTKARNLPVRHDGAGRFTVGSGTQIGLVYDVTAPAGSLEDLAGWSCSCDWRGAGCSHVRAAKRYAEREAAKIQRSARAARSAWVEAV